MVVNQLPEDPRRGVQSVTVRDNTLCQPEAAFHITGVGTGSPLAVHLTHPEVLALRQREILQLAALASAVGMRINAGDRLLCFRGQCFIGINLRVDGGFVAGRDDDIIQITLLQGFLQFCQNR